MYKSVVDKTALRNTIVVGRMRNGFTIVRKEDAQTHERQVGDKWLNEQTEKQIDEQAERLTDRHATRQKCRWILVDCKSDDHLTH